MVAKCQIRCLNCSALFRSPIQFGDARTFQTSGLAGNQVQCPACGKMTGCNKKNMIFASSSGSVSEEGFKGSDTKKRNR